MSGDILTEQEYNQLKNEVNKGKEKYMQFRNNFLKRKSDTYELMRNHFLNTGEPVFRGLFQSKDDNICSQMEMFAHYSKANFGFYFYTPKSKTNAQCRINFSLKNAEIKEPSDDDCLNANEYNNAKDIFKNRTFAFNNIKNKLREKKPTLSTNLKDEKINLMQSTFPQECKDMKSFVERAKPLYGKYTYDSWESYLHDNGYHMVAGCVIDFSLD